MSTTIKLTPVDSQIKGTIMQTCKVPCVKKSKWAQNGVTVLSPHHQTEN